MPDGEGDELAPLDAYYDPCKGRTRNNMPCELPRHHVGVCKASLEQREYYRQFVRDLHERAKTMSRDELGKAVEYHLLAWRVLRNEYNGR